MATTLPSLPQSAAPQGKDGLSRMLVIGTSIFGGGTGVYLVVQIIREEPEKAFKLLTAWGPGYLLALFIAFLVDRVLRKLIDSSRATADSGAEAVRELAVQVRFVAEANSRQAEAMQAMADKDDRDKQEMQILIGVVNNKVEMALDEQKRGNRSLERIENALKINRPESERT